MSQWKEFKKKESKSPTGEEPEGMMIGGTYTCQICYDFVLQGKYFPVDSVLSYKCDNGHLSIIENFNLM